VFEAGGILATQEAGKMPQMVVDAVLPTTKVCSELAAPLVALWDRGAADGSYEDEKKLRADSPAMSGYTCTVR
jgi:hypothetical protein